MSGGDDLLTLEELTALRKVFSFAEQSEAQGVIADELELSRSVLDRLERRDALTAKIDGLLRANGGGVTQEVALKVLGRTFPEAEYGYGRGDGFESALFSKWSAEKPLRGSLRFRDASQVDGICRRIEDAIVGKNSRDRAIIVLQSVGTNGEGTVDSRTVKATADTLREFGSDVTYERVRQVSKRCFEQLREEFADLRATVTTDTPLDEVIALYEDSQRSIALTAERVGVGERALQEYLAPIYGGDLIERCTSALNDVGRKVLNALVEAYPNWQSPEDIYKHARAGRTDTLTPGPKGDHDLSRARYALAHVLVEWGEENGAPVVRLRPKVAEDLRQGHNTQLERPERKALSVKMNVLVHGEREDVKVSGKFLGVATAAQVAVVDDGDGSCHGFRQVDAFEKFERGTEVEVRQRDGLTGVQAVRDAREAVVQDVIVAGAGAAEAVGEL